MDDLNKEKQLREKKRIPIKKALCGGRDSSGPGREVFLQGIIPFGEESQCGKTTN